MPFPVISPYKFLLEFELRAQFLVEDEQANATPTQSDQIGLMLGQLVDSLHLILEKVVIQKVAQMRIAVLATRGVQIQQRL